MDNRREKGIWKPNVYGQVKSWIDQGLESRAISRDLDWGIPIPRDDAKGKLCMYGLMPHRLYFIN